MNADFVCPECGERNAKLEGPCAKCGSRSFRGDRDARAAGEAYAKVADTVGLVPNVRWKDNLYQGLFVGVLTALLALTGFLLDGSEGALLGAALGLIGGLVVSGVFLMILGWIRLAKRS